MPNPPPAVADPAPLFKLRAAELRDVQAIVGLLAGALFTGLRSCVGSYKNLA